MKRSTKIICAIIHALIIVIGLITHIGIGIGYEYYNIEKILTVYAVILIPLIAFHIFSWYVLKESKRKTIGFSDAIELGVCSYILIMNLPYLNDDILWIPWLIILLLRIVSIAVRSKMGDGSKPLKK